MVLPVGQLVGPQPARWPRRVPWGPASSTFHSLENDPRAFCMPRALSVAVNVQPLQQSTTRSTHVGVRRAAQRQTTLASGRVHLCVTVTVDVLPRESLTRQLPAIDAQPREGGHGGDGGQGPQGGGLGGMAPQTLSLSLQQLP